MKCACEDCADVATSRFQEWDLCETCFNLVRFGALAADAYEKQRNIGSVRYAIVAIKGVGAAAAQAIVSERNANGPYKSLKDFADRLPDAAQNKRTLEALAAAGCMDCLEPNRALVRENVDMILAVAKRGKADKSTGDLF